MGAIKRNLVTLSFIALSISLNAQGVTEFEEELSQHLNLESLRENPVLDYDIADSILTTVSTTADPAFVGRFYNLLGRMNLEKGNYAIALEYFNTSEGYLNNDKNSPFIVHNHLDKGNVYFKLRDLTRAEEHYLLAEKQSEQNGDSLSLAIAKNNLGLIWIERGDFNKAETLFLKGYELRINSDNNFLIGHSLQYLGTLKFRQGDLDKALDYFNKARISYERVKTRERNDGYYDNLARVCNDMGYVHARLGNKSAAEVCANDAIAVGKSLINPYSRASISLQSAKLKKMAGNTTKSREMLEELLTEARQYGFKDILQKSYGLLAEIFEEQGDLKKAIDFARLSYDLKETLETDKLARKLADERFSYEVLNNRRKLELAEKESMLKDTQIEAQERITQLLILLILVALLAIGGLYYNNRQRRHMNEQLTETNLLIEKQNIEIKEQQAELGEAKRQLEFKLQELENMSTEKSMLINIVAHDLRNPLNSILGLCDLMEMDTKNLNSDQTQYLKLIRDSSDRMLKMISNLLNVRRIETNGLEVVMGRVEVLPILESIKTDFRQWLTDKNIQINMEGVHPTLAVSADRDLFFQVLENLISNAVKYSPQGAEIEIESHYKDHKIALNVRDHGAGISADEQKKLFQKFQRLSTQPTGGEQSVGLGLSLVKHLTERMGGEVYCTSTLGHGSTFTVVFTEA